MRAKTQCGSLLWNLPARSRTYHMITACCSQALEDKRQGVEPLLAEIEALDAQMGSLEVRQAGSWRKAVPDLTLQVCNIRPAVAGGQHDPLIRCFGWGRNASIGWQLSISTQCTKLTT